MSGPSNGRSFGRTPVTAVGRIIPGGSPSLRAVVRANQSPVIGAESGRAGSRVVLAMIALAGTLAAFAVWFQWRQSHRCLAFYGPVVAAAIQTADRVELWTLERANDRTHVVRRSDVSRAAGLVHLRHGLVEDANFAWELDSPSRLPPADWDSALAFFATNGAEPITILAIDSDDSGWLTVVGKPGRVGLGRINAGLRTWLGSAAGNARYGGAETGF